MSETNERNNRHVYQGRVVSDKMDKTITVVVDTYKNHPVYKKRIKYSKKYYAHDENNEAKIGDTVRIMETRPLSHAKRYRLTKIVKNTKAYDWNNVTLNDEHYCYAYPASLGNLTSIKDANNFEYINSYTKSTVAFANGANYNVYVLTDPVTITGAKQSYK